MSDSIFIGRKAAALEKGVSFEPFTKVVIIIGTDEDGQQLVYTAGNDTGRTLEVNNPWGTQQMANDMLARISGYIYRPYTASGAEISPAAELGDAVTIGGLYSIIAEETTRFNGLTDIGAPDGRDIDHEYPYEDTANREIIRKIADVSSSLRVEIDSISAEVSGKINGTQAQTLITQNLNSIVLSASAGENRSTITIKANGVTVDSAVVTFSSIVADEIVANASIQSPTITGGTITGGTFQVTGQGRNSTSAYYVYRTISSSNKQLVGYLSYDGSGSGGASDQADRMFLASVNNYPLKLKSASNMSLEASGGIYISGTQTQVSGKIILGSDAFGSSLPSSGTYGQIFFLTS